MIPAAFDYVVPDSAEHAVALLADHGDEAKVLAGGQSLLPLMKLRLATPGLLVDIGRINELSYIRQETGYVAIGATTRHCDVEWSGLLRQWVPLLPHVTSQVADPQVRHRGTLVGAIAHGDPASDLAAAALALDASLVILGPQGARATPVAQFFRGFLDVDLSPDEIVTEIRIPTPAASAWSFQKFVRRSFDWAIVGCAIAGGPEPRVALVNMDSRPLRALAVEEALAAGAPAAEAAAYATHGVTPPSDLHAPSEYRMHLARVLVRRSLQEAHL